MPVFEAYSVTTCPLPGCQKQKRVSTDVREYFYDCQKC